MRPDSCPKCEHKEFGGLEYSYGSNLRYDGVSEWACMNCGYRQGRFCGHELQDNEIEKPFCDGSKPHARRQKL